MKLDNSAVSEMISIQKELEIKDNQLLLLAFAIERGVSSTIKTLQAQFSVTNADLEKWFITLMKAELTHKKDREVFDKVIKIDNTYQEVKANTSLENEAKEIITDLANYVKIDFKHTKKRIQMITRWLMQGYTYTQCRMLNAFYFDDWGKNNDMRKYITIETLYNEKFPARIETSSKICSDIFKHRAVIKEICEQYAILYAKIVNRAKIDEITDSNSNVDILSMIPIKTQSSIALWIEKGYSKDEIIDTIHDSIQDWSQVASRLPYISIERILDKKFPERLAVSKRKRDLEKGVINVASKKSLNFDNWTYKN